MKTPIAHQMARLDLTDDYGGGVFFKFEADDPGDYQEGQLYAYKQSIDGQGGE